MLKRIIVVLFIVPYVVLWSVISFMGILTYVPICWIITGEDSFTDFSVKMTEILEYPFQL